VDAPFPHPLSNSGERAPTQSPKSGVAKPIKAAIYARYSSDIQRDISIERQFADLEKAAERLGLKVDKRHYYSDRGQSGQSLFERPGLTRELMGAAKKKQFDVVLVEQTDRLSRRRADLFWLADEFKFDGIRIFTPAGEVASLQLTFDGHTNEDFIQKLAHRVKSGQDAAARAGRIPGPAAYGYDCVPQQKGVVPAGVKIINKEEARVVERVFREYAQGKSPRLIASDLMKDKIPSPTGSSFRNSQSIVGGSGNKRGLLHNQLYIGVFIKNRAYNIKNPATGKTVTRQANPDDVIRVELPDLAIIDRALWDAAHKVRAERGNKLLIGRVSQRATIPRKPHLLSGLLRCAECNGPMIVNFSDRHGKKGICCAMAHKRQNCEHRKTYNLDKITALAVGKLVEHLTDPERLKKQATAMVVEYERLERENNGARQVAQKQLDRLNVQIAKLVRMVDQDDSGDLPEEMLASLKEKEIERRGLKERIRLLGAETNVTTLPSAAIKSFGKSIEKLAAMIERNPDDPACRMALGNVVDSVLVHPTGFAAPYDISIFGRVAAVMGRVNPFSAGAEILAKQAGSGVLIKDVTVQH
jgi:site-specific DNA recombinase